MRARGLPVAMRCDGPLAARPRRALGRRGHAAALVGLLTSCCLSRTAGVAHGDLMGTKVWLDQHLFNMTLKTTRLENGGKVFLMSEEKALENSLDWPPMFWPTLCFLGLGPSSIEYLTAIAQFFPELQLVLLEVEDGQWLQTLQESLGEGQHRITLGRVEEFAEARGPERKSCQAISWSADTPPFSFYKYRELFYSTPYVLALFNMQGCTPESRSDQADKYYCEYLYSSFQSTMCGRINEQKKADYDGEEIYVASVDAGCTENICMCHAHPDTFLDFHFEQLCRKGEEHRFMGQWGQDEFLMRNVFRLDQRKGVGVYVDVGASHPFHLSNTAYFDLCLGWRGACLEPNPRSRPILKALRTCEVVSACAWANSTKMRFDNMGELAAPTTDDTLQPSVPYEMDESLSFGSTYFEATCEPLHDLLRPLEWARSSSSRRPVIDLLSVDAEGAEIEIFRHFPFEAWDIRAVVVETSRRTSAAVDSLLLPRGFIKIAVLGKDAVYVSQSMARSLPPEGPLLPDRIQWNEPGTDEDSTEYTRFQRYFGVDGDLDVEVGDQRLLNETELARQAQRTEAHHNASMEEVKRAARNSIVGGLLSERQRQAMEEPWVQDAMRDLQVKNALSLLGSDGPAFEREVRSSARLREKLAALAEAGVLGEEAAREAEKHGVPRKAEVEGL